MDSDGYASSAVNPVNMYLAYIVVVLKPLKTWLLNIYIA